MKSKCLLLEAAGVKPDAGVTEIDKSGDALIKAATQSRIWDA